MSLIKNIALVGLAVSVFSSFGAFARDQNIDTKIKDNASQRIQTGDATTQKFSVTQQQP